MTESAPDSKEYDTHYHRIPTKSKFYWIPFKD